MIYDQTAYRVGLPKSACLAVAVDAVVVVEGAGAAAVAVNPSG